MIMFILIWLFLGYVGLCFRACSLLTCVFTNRSFSPKFIYESFKSDIGCNIFIITFFYIFFLYAGLVMFIIGLLNYFNFLKNRRSSDIKSLLELRFINLKHGDRIIFVLNNKKFGYIFYQFDNNEFCLSQSVFSGSILNELEILNDKKFYYKYYKDKFIGYTNNNNTPIFKKRKYVTNLVKLLYKMIDEAEKSR